MPGYWRERACPEPQVRWWIWAINVPTVELNENQI